VVAWARVEERRGRPVARPEDPVAMEAILPVEGIAALDRGRLARRGVTLEDGLALVAHPDEVGQIEAVVAESGIRRDLDVSEVVAVELGERLADRGLELRLVGEVLGKPLAVAIEDRAGILGVVATGQGERSDEQSEAKTRRHASNPPNAGE